MEHLCIQLQTSYNVRKHTPISILKVRYAPASSPSSYSDITISAPFSKWFTSKGEFVAKPFQQWLATEIPVVGNADPKNAVLPRDKGQVVMDGLKTADLQAQLDSIR